MLPTLSMEASGRWVRDERVSLAARLNTERSIAHSRLRQWASDPRCVVLDTETTDFDGVVVEVGVVAVDGRELFSSRVNPGPKRPVSEAALRVHGLSAELLKDAPRWQEVAAQLALVLAGRQVLTFNRTFDAEAIRRSCTEAQLPTDYIHTGGWGCLMQAMGPLAGEWNATYQNFNRVSLSRACAWAGVAVSSLPPAHSAVGDAVRAAHVLRAAAERSLSLLPPSHVPAHWLGERGPLLGR